MRRFLVACLLSLTFVPAAAAQLEAPVFGETRPVLTGKRATALFLRQDKVADWLDRYPVRGRKTDADYDADEGRWTIEVWQGKAGQIALGKVDDATGVVTEAWTGPQVAWKMARGTEGAFGGRAINDPLVWLALSGTFLLGLADWRRPLSVRNLDLLVLLSFSVSLWFFNAGEIFASVPLAYPPLAYLLARVAWVALRGSRSPAGRPLWPVWLLAAATVFLAGFRVGLNVTDSNVIDVGYAGVIGAHRIVNGESPYGHMPVRDTELRACGRASAGEEARERVQTNGRCESANERGDTYGPVSYQAYVPGYALFGWTGRWDGLPAAHLTSIAFDLLALLGLGLVGLRFGGVRLGVTLAFAWAAFPFTQYVSSSNTNDTIVPALLILGFWACASPVSRGTAVALAGWTKFSALLLAPLWAAYPEPLSLRRALSAGRLRFAGAFAGATLLSFWILLLEPDPAHAARVFWDRTLGWQLGRESPFSLWSWGQYHAAGIPDLQLLQKLLIGLLSVGALALAFVPRRRSPLRLAALTGALLIGFELVLTHWSYLYIPWFFPFVAFALLAPRQPEAKATQAVHDHETRELVAAG